MKWCVRKAASLHNERDRQSITYHRTTAISHHPPLHSTHLCARPPTTHRNPGVDTSRGPPAAAAAAVAADMADATGARTRSSHTNMSPSEVEHASSADGLSPEWSPVVSKDMSCNKQRTRGRGTSMPGGAGWGGGWEWGLGALGIRKRWTPMLALCFLDIFLPHGYGILTGSIYSIIVCACSA